MRRRAGRAVAMVLMGAWLAGLSSSLQAGDSSAWLFQPSYADAISFNPQQALQAQWREQLFYGGQATGHAIFGYNHHAIRFGSIPGQRFTGSSVYHRWETFFSVPAGF